MKEVTLALVLLVFTTIHLQAQTSISAKFGFSAYQGDLHCRTDDNINLLDELGLSFGLGGRYAITDVIGVRAEATLFKLRGNENNFGDAGHGNRGWTFENNFIETSVLIDYEILGKRKFTPVVFAGIGVAFNNAEVNWKNSTGEKIDNDREKDNMVTVALPVGVGLKYYVSEQFSFAAEFGLRLPVSDYYDGVSESGNPSSNDGYAFMGVKAFFTLN